MTVKELIEALSKFNPELEVMTYASTVAECSDLDSVGSPSLNYIDYDSEHVCITDNLEEATTEYMSDMDLTDREEARKHLEPFILL